MAVKSTRPVRRGLENLIQLALQLDAIRARIALAGSPPTYLTLDINCLDPGFCT
ncbi:MAG: hypothetical protein ABIP64_00410 [Burkholderiales bacterium]